MEHREFESPQELQDSIKCFWYDRKDFGEQESVFKVVPDGYTEIIFHFGSGCSLFHNGILQPLPSPFMMGLLSQPALFYTKNRLEIIGIRCYPWTIFELLGLPSGTGGIRTFEHSMAQLQPVLKTYVDDGRIEEAMAELKQYFLTKIPSSQDDNILYKAGTAIRNANGNLPVSNVAAAAHTTIRTLERKFRQTAGHTVKDVSALTRFEQARNLLWQHPDSNLAGVAAELGYSDQAHLTREFKRFSGATPAVFARKTKKLKSSAGDDFVAFIQA